MSLTYALIIFAILLILIFFGVPIAYSIELSVVVLLVITHLKPLILIPQKLEIGMDTFVYLAIPLFTLAGYLMEQGGLSDRLVDCVEKLFGWFPGSMGTITIICCLFFASLTGSGPATVAAIGAIMVPTMLKNGYSRREAAGLLAAGGALGPIIPPSIAMIVYATTMGLSVPEMFMAALLPGILLGAAFIVTKQFLLSGNFGAILAVLYASIAGLPVPFAPVHLLFINLLTDSLPAIALGLEPHSKEVMKQKPRPMNESILTKQYLLSIGTEGLGIGIMTMAAFLIGYRSGDAVLASTMAFGTLCTSRLVHGFNCKSSRPVLFTKRFFNNIYLIGAFLIGLVLITGVLMIPGLQGIFKVASLNIGQLLTVYGLALLNLPVVQLLKWIRNSR